MSSRRRSPRIAAIVLAAALAAGCGVEAGDATAPSAPPADRAPSSAMPLPPADAPLAGDELLDRVRPSVALVETDLATGSAVLLEDGYLVTNLHVVHPFDAVDLRFEDGEELDDVPVVGVDLVADLAVLGPVESDRRPLALGDPGADGADVFLVGFPGDQEQPDAVITDGVLSRRRQAEGWGLEYLVSDADIAPGQSGGALVDDRGRVVGISSLSDADDFAYALAADDVEDAVGAILDDGGSPEWEPRPEAGSATSDVRTLGADGSPERWYVAAADEDRTVRVAVEGDQPQVAVADPGYSSSPWAANQVALDQEDPWFDLVDAEPLEQDGAASWTFELDAGMDAIVEVASDVGGRYRIEASVPLRGISDTESRGRLEVGEPERDTVGYLEDWAVYVVRLEAGRSYEVAARSASGDMEWQLSPLDGGDDAWSGTDDGGMLDLDAVATVEPTESGLYVLSVWEYESSPTLYEVAVTEQ